MCVWSPSDGRVEDRLACVNYTMFVRAVLVGYAGSARWKGLRVESGGVRKRRRCLSVRSSSTGTYIANVCMRDRVGQQLILNQTTHLNWNVAPGWAAELEGELNGSLWTMGLCIIPPMQSPEFDRNSGWGHKCGLGSGRLPVGRKATPFL